MLFRRVALLCASVTLLGACGAAATDGESAAGRQGPVPVGSLPPTFVPVPSAEGLSPSSLPRTTVPRPPDALVGTRVLGNRALVIGDSVLASTARRYSGTMCDALVPLGWQVEVDAETGRFVEFGDEVLDARLGAGWDTVVIMLGNNYRGNRADYAEEMTTMVERLAPRPVVLLTVSEFTPSRVQVNDVIFELAGIYPHVVVVDWGATAAADPSLTGADNLHLTDTGRVRLATEVAAAFGVAPVQPGRCLPTDFDDDSAGSPDGPATTVARTNRTTTTTSKGTAGSTTTSTSTAGSTTTPTGPSSTASTSPSTAPTTTSPATSGPPGT